MHVIVVGEDGTRLASYHVTSDTTISEVKARLALSTGVPAHRQSLLHKNTQNLLESAATISQALVEDGATLVMHVVTTHQIVTAGFDGVAKLWNADTGECLRTFRGHGCKLYSAALSPDGSRVITTAVDNSAKLWASETGVCLFNLTGHDGPVLAAAFSGDGSFVVTASADHTASVWCTASGQRSQTFVGHSDSVLSAEFCMGADSVLSARPFGASVATASKDGTACLWSLDSGQRFQTFTGHGGPVAGATVSQDGRHLVTASWDGLVKLWNVETGDCYQTLADAEAVVTPSRGGAGFWDGGGKLWDKSAELRDSAGKLWTAESAPSRDGAGTLWSKTGQTVHPVVSHRGAVASVSLSMDGESLITSSWDGTAKVWSFEVGSLQQTFGVHGGPAVYSAMLCVDGATALTAADDKEARLWCVQTGQVLRSFSGHSGRVSTAAFSPEWVP